MRKRLIALASAVVSAAVTAVAPAAPATARADTFVHAACTPHIVVRPCVDWHRATGQVRAVIDVTDIASNYHSPVLSLIECSSATDSSCGPLAANRDIGHIWSATNEFVTSSKTFRRGRWYVARASWTDQSGNRWIGVNSGTACLVC